MPAQLAGKALSAYLRRGFEAVRARVIKVQSPALLVLFLVTFHIRSLLRKSGVRRTNGRGLITETPLISVCLTSSVGYFFALLSAVLTRRQPRRSKVTGSLLHLCSLLAPYFL